jgi:hypothetical protein
MNYLLGTRRPKRVKSTVLTIGRLLPVYLDKTDILSVRRHVSKVPNPDFKRARRRAFRRRTSGNCEAFHIGTLLLEYNMSNSFG